jgi:hypothetical protein
MRSFQVIIPFEIQRPSWLWSYASWIYNYNLVHPISLVQQLLIILFTGESTLKNKVNAMYLLKIG